MQKSSLEQSWDLWRAGKWEDAIRSCEQIIQRNPHGAAAFYLLGNCWLELKEWQKAEQAYLDCLAIYPKMIDGYYYLGVVCQKQGKYEAATKTFDRVLELQPNHQGAIEALAAVKQLHETDNIDDLLDRAKSFYAVQKYPEAKGLCERILQLNAKRIEAYHLLALIFQQEEKTKEARFCQLQIMTLEPQITSSTNHLGLGNSFAKDGDFATAIGCFLRAINLQPNLWEAHFNLGIAYQRTQAWEEGIVAYKVAITLEPNRIDSYLNLGVLCKEAGKYEQAIEIYQQALTIAPENISIYNNLANLYLLLDRLEDGIELCDRVIKIEPEFANAYDVKGACLEQLGQTQEAIGLYSKAIEKNPNLANAHFNLAHALLSLGRFEQGWQEYQWRWQKDTLQYPKFTQPIWNGSFLENKVILLWCEQGFGDAIQFIRYVWQVRELGGKVIVRCPSSLFHVISQMEGVHQVISEDEPIPYFDVHSSVMDLPRVLQTTLDTIPNVVPYLKAPKEIAFILPETNKIKVGIVWQSGSHLGAIAAKLKRHKSLTVDHFLKFAPDRVQLFSLQIENNDLLPAQIIDLSAYIHNFADTASLIEQLDLVISIDTSVAHLAAAMGKPVWLLLPYASDWRWLKDRSDSPWYPTMVLFRQRVWGDWAEVFDRVSHSLAAFIPFILPAAEVIFNQGNDFFRQQEYQAAAKLYHQAIYLGYSRLLTYFNLGVIKRNNSLPEQAIVYFLEALKHNPNYAPAYLCLSKSFIDREMLEEAFTAIQRCLQLSPQLAEAHHTLGLIYFRQGKTKESIGSYRLALRLNPQDALAHYNLAISLLSDDNYPEGWKEYEWRMSAQERRFKQPRWDGSNLTGKKILLWSEGGFGDTIQFLRFGSFLQQQGAKVLLACQQQLVGLLSELDIFISVIPNNNNLSDQDFDVHLPLMSLPFVLGLNHIPCQVPYLSSYRKTPDSPPRKIVIVWASGYRSSPNLYRLYKQKTCPIGSLLKLLSIPHIELYSFQVGKDAKDILPYIQNRVFDWSDRLTEFTDTVELLQEMDLVITVDTAIAHLAGAMGMPVWLLLPFAPDWRWHQNRSDSLWYPTMKLFRQPSIGDWEGVTTQVKNALKELYQPVFSRAQDLLIEANEFHKTKDYDRAITYYKRAIEVNPLFGAACFNLGINLKNTGDFEEAIIAYNKSLDLGENKALVNFSLGNLHLSQNHFQLAKNHFELAIQSNPDFAESYASLGEVLRRQKQIQQSISYFTKAIELKPNLASAYISWGTALAELNQNEEAIEKYLKAKEYEPHKHSIYLNLGVAYDLIGDAEQGIFYCERAIELDPTFAPTYAALGNIHFRLNQIEVALKYQQKAIGLDPNLAIAHYARSNIFLMQGEYLSGWEDYEWRWEYAKLEKTSFIQPQWQGENISGKRLLIWGEQGLGDKLQFIRFVMILQKMNIQVFYLCQPNLKRLFSTIPNLQILPEEIPSASLPDFDYHLPLLSLMQVLKITIARIPSNVPYFFPQTKFNLVAFSGLKVGFVWTSGKHSTSLAKSSYLAKSCKLSDFCDLLSFPDVCLFSLQLGNESQELSNYESEARLIDLSSVIKDFYDTATIVMELDLIITVDTALAHLSGALGKPVWVLLPFHCDWRWLTDREDSPWYPTMRLFRQAREGDWTEVFDRVKIALQQSSGYFVS